MAKVILLDSPSWRLFNPKLHTHLGILYLAHSLREAGHDVKVKDCHLVTSWDEPNGKLILHQERMEPCDVLGISATTANVNWGAEMAKEWPATYKVLGGTHVTHIIEGPHIRFKDRRYFPVFDFLMYGECEEAFVEFCNAIDLSQAGESVLKNLINVPGLIWFDANDKAIFNAPPKKPDVTKLAPAFDLWEAGWSGGGLSSTSAKGKAFDASSLLTASMYTARGCPYGCHFCADARTTLREETLEQIERQAKQLAEMGVGAVRLQDDTLTIKEKRTMQVADILNNYGLKWRGCTRVNLKNEKLFRYMGEHGCTELAFGVEHGSGRMLKAMNKGTTPESNELGLKMCSDAGVIGRAFLMIGFPGEDEESIRELEEWVLRVKPDSVVLSLFQPFPGSDVWNHPERYSVEIPDGAFDKFWQLGGDGDPEMLVLKLPSISRERLFYHRQRLIKIFEENIGKLDRTQVHGNSGNFGPRVLDAGLAPESCIE